MNEIQKKEYQKWLKKIKSRIATSRVKTALSANQELISFTGFLEAK